MIVHTSTCDTYWSLAGGGGGGQLHNPVTDRYLRDAKHLAGDTDGGTTPRTGRHSPSKTSHSRTRAYSPKRGHHASAGDSFRSLDSLGGERVHSPAKSAAAAKTPGDEPFLERSWRNGVSSSLSRL